MDVFGGNWEGHFEKIKADWREKVTGGGRGSHCGRHQLGDEDGRRDGGFAFAFPLARKKVFIRGNHDYWWNGITRLRDRAPDPSFFFFTDGRSAARGIRDRRFPRVDVSGQPRLQPNRTKSCTFAKRSASASLSKR